MIVLLVLMLVILFERTNERQQRNLKYLCI